MEIKIGCPCGQHYAFDVEPVNNAMPTTVNCPGCGADGTQLANQFIANAVTAAAPPAPAVPTSSGLRINRPAETAPAPAAAPQKFFTRASSGEPDKAPPPSQENVLMGLVGGILAAIVAMLIWYGIAIATHKHFGPVAWGLGAMTGFAVRALGRDTTPLLGVIAAICAAAGILGGQFLEVHVAMNRAAKKVAEKRYDLKLEQAKIGLNAKTEQDIRKWLTDNNPGKSESDFTTEDIQDFRDKQQPELQRFLDGTPSRAQFETEFRSKFITLALMYDVFNHTITLFTVLFVIFGIASAYRIASA